MTKTEELIKDALAKQVTRTPDPAPILAALREPRFRRRTRPALVVATIGTALVTTAVLVPASMRTVSPPAEEPTIQQALPTLSSEQAPPISSLTSSIAQAVPGAADSAPIPMQYTLSAPDGYTEDERRSDPDGLNQTRGWVRRGPGYDRPSVSLHVVHQNDPTFAELAKPMEDATTVTINGIQARVRNDLIGTTVVGATIRWKPNDTTVIEVLTGAVPKPKDLALSVAPTVRPDGRSTLTPPLRFGPLPARLGRVEVIIMRPPSGGVAVWVEARNTSSSSVLTAEVITDPKSVDQTPPAGPNGVPSPSVAVPQPDGRRLYLTSGGPDGPKTAELTEYSRAVKVMPPVDLSWLRP